ncbi:protein ROH1-like [Nymphaea colorata]|uniref:Uncharacterized protein n=1 Tax=Nymphaea colorata TaxID=210225 RepID=A0A5K1GWL4_9MAGN|nr:protein ROH1-like [Nymphaea colorata]
MEYQHAATTFASLGRSLLSLRRNQVSLVDLDDNQHHHDDYQKLVADTFLDLASASNNHVLSLTWLLRLLNSFIYCHEHFTSALLLHRPKRLAISDFFDRSLKALDICVAVGEVLDHICICLSHAKIIVHALSQPMSKSHAMRAKKELGELIKLLGENNDTGSRLSGRKANERNNLCVLLHAIGKDLIVPPRAFDNSSVIVHTYTMSYVLAFVMRMLVVAITCGDRGMNTNLLVPAPPGRQYEWAAPMIAIQETIHEEWRKKGKEGCGVTGLMKELQIIERCSQRLTELVGSDQLLLEEGKITEVRQQLLEMKDVCDSLEKGLKIFRRQVREAFHRIIKGRNKVLVHLCRSVDSSKPFPNYVEVVSA